MASGFPARFAETRAYQLQDEELSSLVKEAFDDLGWRYEIVSRTEFRARTPFMFFVGAKLRDIKVTGFAGSLVRINNVTGDGLKGAAAIGPPKLPEPVK